MTPEKAVDLMLREYDALRKEIDARTDATRTYGWPVIALVFAGVFGLRDVLANTLDILILFAPAVAMTIAGLAANANYAIDKARLALARIEYRVFEVTGAAPLRHETEAVSQWRSPGTQLGVAVAASILYGLVEVWLFSAVPETTWGSVATAGTRRAAAIALLAAPAIKYLYHSVRRYQLRDPIRNEEFAPLAPLREQIEAGSRATLAG